MWERVRVRGYVNLFFAFTVAYGSTCELETQILLSGDLGFIKAEDLKKLQKEIGEVERMLKALIKSLQNKHLNP
ncbi:MAG: four helix bundle protein [Thermodesulfovibrionia bacterium]|nr:four helix bundle protein [Thermodesulfovibrionia bacterium]